MREKDRPDLYAEFLKYHEANPSVYPLIDRFAHQAIRSGREHYGIAPIWERVRWEIDINTRSNIEAEDFKMPNNHRAYYSRMWLDRNPDHLGFFRIAQLRSARWQR